MDQVSDRGDRMEDPGHMGERKSIGRAIARQLVKYAHLTRQGPASVPEIAPDPHRGFRNFLCVADR